uniref:Uncharacterized protein n=1 Tax=Astyanax mexicanus TaxID=7994 RepID=A0A3B1K777_ASTMX
MSAKRRCGDQSAGKCGKKEKRAEPAVINPDLQNPRIRTAVELDCEPFLHCKISNFVQNQSFVQGLQEELLQLNFNSKSNDLYKFLQVL